MSREIITYSLFLGATGLHVVTGQHELAFLWLSVLCGTVAVLSMDRVYSVTATRGLTLHSARVLFIAAFLAGVIANEPVVFLTFGAIRGLLYIARRIRFAANLSPAQWALSGARILFGLALPFAWTTAPSGGAWIPLAGVLLGELIDRAEFYTELDISTPRRQAAADLTATVRSLA